MQKSKFLALALLFLSGHALSEVASHSFTLFHEGISSCGIRVNNDNINGVNLQYQTPYTADLSFFCNDLNGMEVALSSQNGGLKRTTGVDDYLHYRAIIAAANLSPEIILLDTEKTASHEVSSTFVLSQPSSSIDAELSVELNVPMHIPQFGRYEDLLTVTLRAPLVSAS